MSSLKIVFMGTPDFAVQTLKALVENKYNVVGVITAPDRPAGRGQKLKQSAVKVYAQSQNLTVLQPTNLKSEAFLTELKNLDANLQIIVAFRMLPKVVWSMPKYGTFNLHASLLPEYRGAAPINWAIINGETVTGNTTFFIDDKIDTGEIILQQKVEIPNEMNAGALHDELMTNGAQLVTQTIKLIENGTIETKPQPSFEPKTAYKLNKENTKIDWTKEGNVIYNLIRGLSPYPAAWCYLNDKNKRQQVKILASNLELSNHDYGIGEILVKNKELKVAINSGFIVVTQLQLPGKKAMSVKSLLNGYSFDDDAFLD